MPRNVFLTLLLLLVSQHASFGQSATIDAQIEIQNAPASCSFNTSGGDLDFGGIHKPTDSGTNDAVMDAATGTLVLQGSGNGGTFGTPRVGAFSLGGTNTSSFTVDITFPSALMNTASALAFAGDWAHSTDQSSGFTPVPGTSYSGSGPGTGPFTHYFRVGGTAGGIESTTAPGTFAGTVTVSGSCN